MGWVGALGELVLRLRVDVSIPERVWGGLEPPCIAARIVSVTVSIPERVWGGLEPAFREIIQPFLLVSIPERVWGGLERAHPVGHGHCHLVSIPERVWGGLEQDLTKQELIDALFQSLRGFGVGWSSMPSGPAINAARFNP